MNVLVIGGTRFMGRRLVWRLIASGARVTLFNRGREADPFGPRVERLRGDRGTDAFARLLAGRAFDAVVDFAAFVPGDVLGVVETLGASGAGHYVFVGTGQVYLVRDGCPAPASEDDYDGPLVPRPDDPADHWDWEYGMGKRGCEDALVEAERAAGFRATRLRLPIVNGEGDPSRRLESYLWRLVDGGPMLLPDGGTKVLRQVYAGEVARAIAWILGRSETFGRAYNVCQHEQPTLRELVDRLARSLGARPRLVPVPSASLEAAGVPVRDVSPFSGRWTSHLDPARAVAELGFTHVPLDRYLDSVVASWAAHTPAEPPPGYAARRLEAALAEG